VSAFELKGQTFPLTVLELRTEELSDVERELRVRLDSAPELLRSLSLVIDLGNVDRSSPEFSLHRLVEMFRSHGCMPVGVLGDDVGLRRYAASAGLGLLSGMGKARSTPSGTTPVSSLKMEPTMETLVVEKPVRSGQQVYAKGKNLVVLASVSTGAEILADGDIHIYGALRGRALAGAAGNDAVGIYCLEMMAELVSINGLYQISDELPGDVLGRPARVFRQDEELFFRPLNVVP